MTKYIVKEISLTEGQVKKLAAADAKQRPVSLKIKSNTESVSKGILTKLMLTKKQINKYNRGKPFVLNLSATQITAMANDIVVEGGFFGPALSVWPER